MNYEKHFVLSLFTRTWVRDSHGLYDYESTQTKNLNAVLADKVWSLDGTCKSFDQLRKMGHLTIEARKTQLEKIILSLQSATI